MNDNIIYTEHLKGKINELRKQCGELQYIIGQLNDRRREMIYTAAAVGAIACAIGALIGYLVGRM